MARRFQLGFTLGRRKERAPRFGPDMQIEVRPTITGSRIGGVIAAGLAFVLFVALPEARLFLLGTIVVGALIGLVMWLRHRKGIGG